MFNSCLWLDNDEPIIPRISLLSSCRSLASPLPENHLDKQGRKQLYAAISCTCLVCRCLVPLPGTIIRYHMLRGRFLFFINSWWDPHWRYPFRSRNTHLPAQLRNSSVREVKAMLRTARRNYMHRRYEEDLVKPSRSDRIASCLVPNTSAKNYETEFNLIFEQKHCCISEFDIRRSWWSPRTRK